MESEERKTNDTIELINSCGPFNHSIWEGNGFRVTHEEGLSGRAEFLVKKIRKIILDNFSYDEIKKMRIADIGCYDGWILHQLSDLPFEELVGIEQRAKNISKGEQIREILGIKTRVVFKEGDIENIDNQSFDIVLCLGLFHHLESISAVLKKIDLISKKMIIVDTVVMPSSHITGDFQRDIEMKDIIYFYKKKECGFMGQKYESSYYDGSVAKTTVVSIPSLESLKMYLDVLGYGNIHIIATPDIYAEAIPQNERPFQAVLFYAIKNDKNKWLADMDQFIRDYEEGLVKTLINQSYIEPLYNVVCLSGEVVNVSQPVEAILQYVRLPKGESPAEKLNILATYFKNRHEMEIIKNLKFNPVDKICFEWGKILYQQKNYDDAIEVLQKITKKINADWRCVYRSFYLLSGIYQDKENQERSGYYLNLCKKCNPNFPLL